MTGDIEGLGGRGRIIALLLDGTVPKILADLTIYIALNKSIYNVRAAYHVLRHYKKVIMISFCFGVLLRFVIERNNLRHFRTNEK